MPEPEHAAHLAALQSVCREVRFEPGAQLRREGRHYKSMYVLTEGAVGVDLQGKEHGKELVLSGPGLPIGEIGYLRGCPATATVTAKTEITALLIDDPTLGRIEREQPDVAAALMRRLAEVAEDRTSYNLTFSSPASANASSDRAEIYLCRTKEMLESAQRLRYEVYCGELGRNSPYADHSAKLITDELDGFAATFIAVESGETVGTVRTNISSDGPIGVMEDLYGMKGSPHYPRSTGICTKFVIKKSKRRSTVSVGLMSAVTRYGLEHGIKECYIDSVPALVCYYKAIGFKISGPKFFHRENGPSVPMKLDVTRHGARLSRDLGRRDYLNLYLKAQLIKRIDGIRERISPA
jgi:CRP-like cAMP-binding protein